MLLPMMRAAVTARHQGGAHPNNSGFYKSPLPNHRN